MGRCVKIQANQFHQTVPSDGFDAAGNSLKCTTKDASYQFAYDDYYQIKSEEGHVNHIYKYDSLFNRVAKDGEASDHNALNQVISNAKEKMFYDANGNLTQRVYRSRVIDYAYDALDRLVSVVQDGRKTHYFYDSFNRRLIKRGDGDQDEQLYLYQGQEEIGKWMQGSLQELRIIGKNERTPMDWFRIDGKALYSFERYIRQCCGSN